MHFAENLMFWILKHPLLNLVASAEQCEKNIKLFAMKSIKSAVKYSE